MTTTISSVCPRCEAPLFDFGWEPCCLLCGFADYTYDEEHGSGESLLSSATTIVLRYVGDQAALAELTANLICRRIGTHSRLEFFVGCPWCAEEMRVSSVPGKMKDKQASRYKCAAGHLVKLTGDNGSFGWQ